MSRKFFFVILLLVCFSFVLCADCGAGSIWAKRDRNSKPVYADDKAYRAGDILTIIINEDHKVDSKVKRDLQRDSSRSIDFSGGDIELSGSPLPNVPDLPSLKINTGSAKSLQGKADYKDERTIEDRITVIVQDVHPNGNLVVLGSRTRDISGDKQIIQVSGIVRPADILFNNTVKSEQIANFNLVTIGKGVSENYNNPGWLGKVLDKLWPF